MGREEALPELTGGEAVVETLKALGVTHAFGIVSVHNLPIFDAINRLGGITLVPVRHEQGAVHTADGYARATGRLGVAIVSTGPGTTNAMTGLFEAAFASSPVLLITGQIDSPFYGKGKGFLHEAEQQLLMLRTVVRRAESVRRTADIPATLRLLAHDALVGRPQPVAVEIPIDLQYAKDSFDIPTAERATGGDGLDGGALDRAGELLSGASRPLIWAGGGAVSAGATLPLGNLADVLDAPVVTTVNGRGVLPEDDPRCLGAVTAQPAVAALMAEADVVLGVGTRFQSGSTNQWRLGIPGTLVHLDADPAVVGRSYEPAVSLIGDAFAGLAHLGQRVTTSATEAGWLQRAQEAGAAAKTAMRAVIGDEWGELVDGLRAVVPHEANIVRDATVPAYLWADRLFPIYEPRTSMNPTSAAIGPGLPLAIGASIGSQRPTLLIAGDGGFMLNMSELATLAQAGAPVVACVFNDGGYGILRMIQTGRFEGRHTGVDLTTPDFAAVSTAMGVPGVAASGIDGVIDAVSKAFADGGPALIDIDMSTLPPLAFGRR